MLYSKNALATYCSINDDPHHIASLLTTRTCEIEEVIDRQLPDGLVVGYVESLHKHPDADKLQVCTIRLGDETVSISTGATNVRADAYVPVATVGTYLSAVDLDIQPREMRGIMSYGMLCSLTELGLADESDGIWVMDDDIEMDETMIGQPLGTLFPWMNNTIRDVENKTITNRPDLTGHLGLGIELTTIYQIAGATETMPSTTPTDPATAISMSRIPQIHELFAPQTITDLYANATRASHSPRRESDNVRTLCTITLRDIQVRPSDIYTQIMLRDLGGIPKSNWVDLSNIFMFVTGQPIHCYDADKINGTIVGRQAREGEVFVDIFGDEHTLHPDDIVIADETQVLGLAGIVGGQSSAISDTTTSIIIEYANFDPTAVRKTAQRHNLRTDASMRFEKNINPLYSYGQLTLLKDTIDHYIGTDNYTYDGVTHEISPARSAGHAAIDTDPATLLQHIHPDYTMEAHGEILRTILTGLGCTIREIAPTHRAITPPAWRSPDDLTISADIVEEICRIYGYDRIDPLPIRTADTDNPNAPIVDATRLLETLLIHECDADLIETYPWTDDTITTHLPSYTPSGYSIQNPVRPEATQLRSSLMPGLLGVIQHNHPTITQGRLAEIGRCRDGKHEQTHVALCIIGKTPHTETPLLSSLFLQLTTALHTICERREIDMKQLTYEQTDHDDLHPSQQYAITRGAGGSDPQTVGYVRVYHPYTLDQLGITTPVGSIELVVETLVAITNDQSHHEDTAYTTLADVIVTKEMTCELTPHTDIRTLLADRTALPEIHDAHLHDLYIPDEGPPRATCRIAIVIDEPARSDAIIHDTLMASAALLSQHHASLYGSLT